VRIDASERDNALFGANPSFTIGGRPFGVGDTRKRINEYCGDPDRVHPFTHARGAPR
jgi:hypothetical protein